MSLIFGGGGGDARPQFSGLAIQTSTSSVPITILFGKNRLAPNILLQTDFQSHKQKQGKKGGGKGGGKGVTQYTYSATFQLGLCYGPCTDVVRVWKDQSKETNYANLGFSLFTGAANQAPWGYLTTAHPEYALGYPHIVHMDVANYDLGMSNVLSQHSFEVEGPLYNTQVGGTGDADPAQCVDKLINDPIYGAVGGQVNTIDLTNLLSTGAAATTGDSAFQTYCRALGFGLSPALITQEPASEILKRWTDLCNTAMVWTGAALRFIPRSSEVKTANGVTYLPNVPVCYSLTDRDFISGSDQDPITFDRVDPADAYNSVTLMVRNRSNEYNSIPAEWSDSGLIDQFGQKPTNAMDCKEVCEPAMGELMAALIGQRTAYIRNSYSFRLPVSYCRLEPMDILECYDPRWGTFLVRVRELEEDDEDQISVVADEYDGAGVGSAGPVSNVPITNTPVNTSVAPGPVNPPIIFEPPSSLSPTPQVWAAVSGGNGTTANPNWGGCYVWLSTDNITYVLIGKMESASKQGKLTAVLPTYGGANPDTVSTLRVSMAMSDSELDDATSANDAASGVTRSYVDGEILSYTDATLTGTDLYDLDDLYRGQYGTTIGAHAIGSNYALLDGAIFTQDLIDDYVGVLLYMKFQSFNIFGMGVEDISTVVAYTYTPTGAGFGTGAAGSPATPTGLAGSGGSVYCRLTWTANSTNDNVTGYQVWRATGSGQPFGSAVVIGTATGAATEYTDASVTELQAYTYFLRAVNIIGASVETAGINLTPTASTAPTPFGFGFTKPGPVASKIVASFDSPLAWAMPAGLAGSQATIINSDTATATAPSAETNFDIQSPPGVSVGTMRFAASSLTATYIMASTTAVPLGQLTTIVAPANLNGIVGTITGSILGTK